MRNYFAHFTASHHWAYAVLPVYLARRTLSALKTALLNAIVQGMNAMNNRLITAAVATALGSGSLIAHAGDWYVTAGGGQARQTLNSNQVNDDWATDLAGAGATFTQGYSGVSSTLASHSSSAWRAGVGYEFLPFLAGEVEYLHLGQSKAILSGQVDGPEGAAGFSTYKQSAWGVSAVAKWPMIVSPYVRLGVLRWDESVNVTGTVYTISTPPINLATAKYAYSETGQSAYGGIGVGFKFPGTPIALRAEWDKLKIADSKPDLLTVAVVVSLP
jgi:hypothetical protein